MHSDNLMRGVIREQRNLEGLVDKAISVQVDNATFTGDAPALLL